MEKDARFERQDNVLLLDSGRPPVRASGFVGSAALVVMFFLIITSLQGTQTRLYIASGTSLILLMWGFAFAMASRQSVAEFDTAIRRLKILRLLFGGKRVIVTVRLMNATR
jgi:hypothetical protein